MSQAPKFLSLILTIVLISGCTSSYLDIFPELDDPSLMGKKIEPELLKQDIQAYYQGALDRHPNLAKYASKVELENNVRVLQAEITKPMTRLEFYKIVGRLTHKFNDGHSMLIWPYQEYDKLKSAGSMTFPFAVKITPKGEIFIKHEYKSDKLKLAAGTKIISINKLSSEELLNYMQKYVGGESEYLRQQFVADRFGLTLWAVFSLIDNFEIELEFEGKASSLSVNNVQNWNKIEQENTNKKDFYLKQIEQGIGYLYIGHFDVELGWFENFIDESFAEIKQTKLTSLIIDIRDNTGGNTDTATYLARYIAKKDFRMISKMTEKLNLDNRGFLNYKGEVGEYIEHEWDDWEKSIGNENLFKGQTYLLVSPITYSAGIVFATTVKDNDMAILIGQETGGYANQTAQGNLFNLPNSQLRAYITTRMLVRPSGSTAPGGVKPHYQTVATSETIAAQQDVELEKALELIYSK